MLENKLVQVSGERLIVNNREMRKDDLIWPELVTHTYTHTHMHTHTHAHAHTHTQTHAY